MTSRTGVFRGLDTVLLRVKDIDLAKSWYQEKLGFSEPYFDPVERLAVFDLGGTTSLTLWELKRGEITGSTEHTRPFPIFSVSDAHETRRVLMHRGVAVGEVVESAGVSFFTFTDPDGNLLEACQVH